MGGGQNIKNDDVPIFPHPTPVPRVLNHPNVMREVSPSVSSLNGHAGGLLCRVVAILLSVVRVGDGDHAGCRGRPWKGGKAGGSTAQGSSTCRRLA